ncbi:xylulokinase [Scrofimicrobium sp. R131]|uniref:FGGY-family carbohydrate kinase n=1 Tax=Scrofimicrobium appendicitidis TaxID=3079930 RepID=A0AAU7V9C5_9ACTO
MTSQQSEAGHAAIAQGRTALGIELGSTRIKAVLIDEAGVPLATGGYGWNNTLVDGLWTYPWDSVWEGLRGAYADLVADVRQRYDLELTTVGSLAISAMMHGYVPLDEAGEPVAGFRTWRNTNTAAASTELSELFQVNIPHRWSIAHLYQAVLDGEDHLSRLAHITTLSGLVHLRLSGQFVLGVGDASGMFPIDSEAGDYDRTRLAQFAEVAGARGWNWDVDQLLPRVLVAGQEAGRLTEEGAALLDPTGKLQPGIVMAPPEGDAGTGMVATNALAPRTGNVSAGTSIFAMVVLERTMAGYFPEIDPVTTPEGLAVAMVHSNNGTSELDQWVGVFAEFARSAGQELELGQVYQILYQQALTGAPDAGGLLAYNLLSGEPIVNLEEGRPLYVRSRGESLTLANFIRAQLLSVFGTLRLGMEILADQGVEVELLRAHGGLFKTAGVAQRLMAGALQAEVEVGSGAGEGGAWGAALLALYRAQGEGKLLRDFVAERIFADAEAVRVAPDPDDVAGFEQFMDRYRRGLPVVAAAVDCVD